MRGMKSGAKYLRAAAVKMNDGGQHWTKRAFRKIGRVRKDGTRKVSFCYLGGIHEVMFGQNMECDHKRFNKLAYCLAVIESARLIAPDAVERQEWRATQRYPGKGGKVTPTVEKSRRRSVAIEAESIVVSFNDSYKTEWDDVKGILLGAADSLEAKAS
jgi:hypothetical protein